MNGKLLGERGALTKQLVIHFDGDHDRHWWMERWREKNGGASVNGDCGGTEDGVSGGTERALLTIVALSNPKKDRAATAFMSACSSAKTTLSKWKPACRAS